MNFGAIVARARKVTADNAPTILTSLGVTGLVTTAVLTGQASFKAAEVLVQRHHELVDNEFEPLPAIEKTKIVFPLVWQYFIPAVGTGAVAITCIIAANHIQTRRAAALASAYTLSQEFFKEYKGKVLEKLGDKKEQEVRDEIAQERVDKNPPSAQIVVVSGLVLCLDRHTGRYFQSDMETIRRAENDLNQQIINQFYASLSDFYYLLGLEETGDSDELGWNCDELLKIDFSTVLGPNNQPCLVIDYNAKPIRDYNRVH